MASKSKHLILDIRLEGAALTDGFGEFEAATILRAAAAKIEGGALHSTKGGPLSLGYAIPLLDSNGNTVGIAEVKER